MSLNARKTPPHDIHAAEGASLGLFEEHLTPLSYGDWIAEHYAVRHATGIIDRSYRAKLAFRGADRRSYLGNMLSNDVKPLGEGAVCEACLLTVKGRILAHFRIAALPDELLTDLAYPVADAVADELERFIILEDVTIQRRSDELALFGIHGPQAEAVLTTLLGADPPGRGRCVTVKFRDQPLSVVSAGYTGEPGWDLYVPASEAVTFWQAAMAAGACPVGWQALNALRVEAGEPWHLTDFDENHFPPEVGLEERTISYTKGCYRGQEVIARMHSRGHCNRFLTGLRLGDAEPPMRGTAVRLADDDKEIGVITSAVRSPELGETIALAIVRHEHRDPGLQVEVNAQPATVAELPFVRPVAG